MQPSEEKLRNLVQEYSPTACPAENAAWGRAALSLDKAHHEAMGRRLEYHAARKAAIETHDFPDEAVARASRAYSEALRAFDTAEAVEREAFFLCAYLVAKSLGREAADAAENRLEVVHV